MCKSYLRDDRKYNIKNVEKKNHVIFKTRQSRYDDGVIDEIIKKKKSMFSNVYAEKNDKFPPQKKKNLTNLNNHKTFAINVMKMCVGQQVPGMRFLRIE